jgi:hypothetical protein
LNSRRNARLIARSVGVRLASGSLWRRVRRRCSTINVESERIWPSLSSMYGHLPFGGGVVADGNGWVS